MTLCLPITLQQTPQLLLQDAGWILHPNPQLLHLKAWLLLHGSRIWRWPVQRQLNKCSWMADVRQLVTLISKNGLRFQSWCATNYVKAVSAPLSLILDYILHLKRSGLSVSSICVRLAAIMAFPPSVDSRSLFIHPLIKIFLKGLQNFYSHIRDPTPALLMFS